MEHGVDRSSAAEALTELMSAAERKGEPHSGAENALKGVVGSEDASRYCPVCSQRLLSRRCKLVCNVCGYYMSCADYY